MAVRKLQEMGENLQLIVKRLLANQTLLKLLYYTDKDPLSQPELTKDIIKEEVFEKNLNEDSQNKPRSGRPRKPIDPELANKPKLPRGRPRKPVDPEMLNKPKRPKGRPKKMTGNI